LDTTESTCVGIYYSMRPNPPSRKWNHNEKGKAERPPVVPTSSTKEAI